MLKKLIDKTVKSVLAKLLVVMVLTGLLLNLLFGAFFGHVYKTVASAAFDKNVRQYIRYIIVDLGNPPSLERALALKAKIAVDIRFEGSDPASSWSTFAPTIPPRKIRWRIWNDDPDVQVGRYHRHHYIRVAKGPGRFTFKLIVDESRKRAVRHFGFIVLLALPLIMAAAFLVIRRILRPIAWLTEGVRQVSQGNLKHRVIHRRTDELGRLADAFNTMTQRVEAMLDAREQLLLDVSHELRSPLTRMKVALEFLPASDTKTSLEEDLTEMGKMVTNILEAARLRNLALQLNKEPVSLGGLIRDAVALFSPPGEAPAPIELLEWSPSPTIAVDADKIRVVLKNILDNALKYSPPGSPPVTVALIQRPPFVLVRITDGGIGIPPEELPLLFEPFYRADKSRSKLTGGYGLGLSICKRIMDAHKGRIDIQSRPGEGTRVTLFFPANGN